MKVFDERLNGKNRSPYVAKITVDVDISSLCFQDNTLDNYKALKGIFSTYQLIRQEGQIPVKFDLIEHSNNEIVLTGDLKELVELIRNMRLIRKETKALMDEFIDE